MALGHEPARFVGTDVENSQIDLIFAPQLFKTVEIGGVSGEIDGIAAAQSD